VTSGEYGIAGNHGVFRSPVFRMVSRDQRWAGTEVNLRFRSLSWQSRELHQWSGLHVFLRYRSETELYVVSIARADGKFAIKRKRPGGPSNGGTYETLAESMGRSEGFPTTHDATVRITGTNPTHIEVTLDGTVVAAATDTDTPIETGRIGLRSDDLTWELHALTATPK
jgi:hypothetical protein